MSAGLVRGHWLKGAGDILRTLSEEGSVRADVFARLEEAAGHLESVGEYTWCPRGLHLQMLNAIAAASRDEASAMRHLSWCGQRASSSAGAGDPFFRAALQLMTPALLTRSIAKLWALEHQGEETFELAEHDAEGGRAVLRLTGAQDYSNIAPVALGWVQSLWSERGGAVEVTQEGWKLLSPSPREVRYELALSAPPPPLVDEEREIRELTIEAMLTLSQAHRDGWANTPTLALRGPTPLKIFFAWYNELAVSLTAEHEQGLVFRGALEEKLATVEQQRAAIRDLSTPIIELWNGVLCLPIVGVIDTSRSVDVTATLLKAIVEKDARHAIVDITGIEVMDTRTVDHFIQMAKAVRMLGARYALAGVSPHIAQTVVRMGLDLDELTTYRNLREALQAAIQPT